VAIRLLGNGQEVRSMRQYLKLMAFAVRIAFIYLFFGLEKAEKAGSEYEALFV
jgi:hypothetical protein